MNKLYGLWGSAMFVLAACASVNQPGDREYLDLVGNKVAVEKY